MARAAARTIPASQKRRTCTRFMMSCKIVTSKELHEAEYAGVIARIWNTDRTPWDLSDDYGRQRNQKPEEPTNEEVICQSLQPWYRTRLSHSAYVPVHLNLRRLVEASIGLGGPMRKLALL